MAFQAGSTIRPELGNADYSGFARAAEIQASSLAQLGVAIGGAIEKHQEKKIKKQEEQVSLQAIKSLFPQLDDDTAKAIVRDDTVRDLFKSTLKSETVSPVSPGVTKAAAAMAEEAGFTYNKKTGNMEREVQTGEPSFLGMIGNVLRPGQPFTPTATVTMPQEIIEGTTGMSEAIRNKRLMQEQERMASDPLGLGL